METLQIAYLPSSPPRYTVISEGTRRVSGGVGTSVGFPPFQPHPQLLPSSSSLFQRNYGGGVQEGGGISLTIYVSNARLGAGGAGGGRR